MQSHNRSQSGGLAGTGLSLGDDVLALDDGHDSTLLDGRGAFETGGFTDIHVSVHFDRVAKFFFQRGEKAQKKWKRTRTGESKSVHIQAECTE